MTEDGALYAAILYRTEMTSIGPMRWIAHVLDGSYTTQEAALDAAQAALPEHPDADDYGAQAA